MEVAFFNPYGSSRPESTIAALLGRYLRRNFSVGFLRCNGVFSTCQRDEETDWTRHVRSCTSCMTDQSRISKWVGADDIELSKFLSADIIRETQEWVSSLTLQDIESSEYKGCPTFEISRSTLTSRFGGIGWNLSHSKDESIVRRTLLSCARMIAVSKKFLSDGDSELVVATSGEDFLTKAFIHIATTLGKKSAILRWDLSHRGTLLEQYPIGGGDLFHLVLDSLEEIDPDPSLWPGEVMDTIHSLASRLNLSHRQLRLLS